MEGSLALKFLQLVTKRMASVFQEYNELLDKKTWSLRFWDGRPTEFLPVEEYEDLFLRALEENDIPSLNIMLDEIRTEFMGDVADRVAEMSYPEELEWYVTTTYPPLFETFTPQRFLDSVDLQDALVTWPHNLYTLVQWWMTQSYGKEAIKVLKELFLSGTLVEVIPAKPSLTTDDWRRQKKARFLVDREVQGFTNPVIGAINPPAVPRRQPRILPPRQGPSSP